MIGPWLNLAGIVLGGILGLTVAKGIPPATQLSLKRAIALVLFLVGFKLIWDNVGGAFAQVGKQLAIALLALSVGNLVGALLHFQRGANFLGRKAAERFNHARTQNTASASDAILTVSLLYASNPIGIIGPIHEGLSGDWRILLAKAALDGLATLGFVGICGWPVILSGIAGLAYQSILWLAAHSLLWPYLPDRNLIDAIGVTSGFILISSALVALDLRKVALANFIPALFFAPLLTAWWR
jgi:uncharacterized membrane protein YqgA involved in biofilm formation